MRCDGRGTSPSTSSPKRQGHQQRQRQRQRQRRPRRRHHRHLSGKDPIIKFVATMMFVATAVSLSRRSAAASKTSSTSVMMMTASRAFSTAAAFVPLSSRTKTKTATTGRQRLRQQMTATALSPSSPCLSRAVRGASPSSSSLSSSSSGARDETATATAEKKKNDADYWTTDRARDAFVEYFTTAPRNHAYVPSGPVVPVADPTLLFTNAGMNQFKSIFLGVADPAQSSLTAACNYQKCIRAGGKHNDLEDVGADTYHHTFFEMLGSWSFNGAYGKADAVRYAWELLTVRYGLDADRLYATYFAGDETLGLAADERAADLWRRYLPADRVLACGAADNFWEMGETGPCGPCSEVHYDRVGGGRDAAALVNADDPDVIEIWNLVFIQYDRQEQKGGGSVKLLPLPAEHVDTGMGLERLVSILQDKSSNYDTDGFARLIRTLERFSAAGPYTGAVAGDDDEAAVLRDTAYRAVVDHARCLAFAVADGAVPSNEGRGYVLRRILRRAARYGRQILRVPGQHCVSALVPAVVETYGAAYPELRAAAGRIERLLRAEEESFASMLERGIAHFTEQQERLAAAGADTVSGQTAFYLYDTLGFPVDLTRLMAEEAGLSVDVAGFEAAMEEQKERSRQARKTAKAAAAGEELLELRADDTAWLQRRDNIHVTDDSFKYKSDVTLPATVMAVFAAVDKDSPPRFLEPDEDVEAGAACGLVLDKTSFYAEAGGQEADTGTLELLLPDDGEDNDAVVIGRFTVTDVQQYAGFVLHTGVLSAGSKLKAGSAVNCRVDYDRRKRIAPNHSMTHVLNAALRKVLGDAADQKGSLVSDEKLRFDFAHDAGAVTAAQLSAIEGFCQDAVAAALPVANDDMPLETARQLPGVRAVFGESYPDPVRVVTIGGAAAGDDGADAAAAVSIEFCGGTHVTNTAQAAAFCLTEETAVAKGIRRVTAVTGEAAVAAVRRGDMIRRRVERAEELLLQQQSDETAAVAALEATATSLRKDLDGPDVMSAAVKAVLRSRVEALQKQAADAKKKQTQRRVDTCLQDVKEHVEQAVQSEQQFLVLSNVDIGADSKASQRVLNAVLDMAPGLSFMGLSLEDNNSDNDNDEDSGRKLLAFCVVPAAASDCSSPFRADDWVRAALEPAGGRGGGKPTAAQGQAKSCRDVDAVYRAAVAYAEEKQRQPQQ